MTSVTVGDRRAALALGAAAALTFALLGPALHAAPGLGGEADGYDGLAQRMADGLDAGDPYHPYGVPLLLLAVMQCGLDAFAAGRLVAAIAAGTLVGASFLLLRRVVSPLAASLATVATATAEITFVNAQLASSDMPAAAFVALALLGWCRVADRTPARAARSFACACLAFGLALACRPSSLFVAAGALPLLVGVPWRTVLARCILGGAATTLGLAPHWLAQRIWGAGPPHPGNLANLVLKYRFDFDYDRIAALDREAIQADLREHWFEYLQRGLGDVWALFTHDIARCLVQPPAGWPTTALALVLTTAVLSGLVRDRGARVLALAALGYGVLLALTFTPVDRMLLPLLPAVLPLLLAAARAIGPRAALATAALTLLATLSALPGVLQRFAEAQTTEPFAAMRGLLAREGRPLIFLGDVGRTGDVPGALLIGTFAGWRGREPADQVAWLREQIERHHPDYVVYSRVRSAELLAHVRAATLPDGWTIERDDAVFVLRVPPPDHGDWGVAITSAGDEQVLSFRVPSLPGAPRLAHGAFVARAADGTTQLLPATAAGDGAFELRLPAGSLRGELQLTPMVLAEPGGFLRGAPLTHTFADAR